MTPEQKLKHLILMKHATFYGSYKVPDNVSAENIDELYDEANENGELQDARYESREGEIETDIESPYSRHYESRSVAAQYVDGSWIGWTYWYGGGKYGEPESIDWMNQAYDLTCEEKQVTITQRNFTKV